MQMQYNIFGPRVFPGATRSAGSSAIVAPIGDTGTLAGTGATPTSFKAKGRYEGRYLTSILSSPSIHQLEEWKPGVKVLPV